MIHYITSWARNPEKDNLRQYPAAATKSEYVVDTIKKVAGNHRVNVLCLAQTLNRKWYWVPRSIQIYDAIEINEVIPSIGSPIRLVRGLNIIIQEIYLLYYFLYRIKKEDIVVLYHSCSYATAAIVAHKLRKIPIILEVEEIYQDVNPVSARMKRAEYDVFERAAAYIFSSVMLNQSLNRKQSFNDRKIHVVYAGTLDPRKGGAVAAVAAAEFLLENYHVHILGFGSDQQIDDMKRLTHEVSQKGGATVTYDGLLSGEDYIRFIQACDIGLSTQNPDAAFNATSFPSKVLSYMANGLRVVSARIEAVESSAVGDMITYYEKQTPECIAEAVMSVDMSQPYDSRKRISELDKQFQKDLQQLIEAK